MKLRCTTDSIRLRLRKSDLAQLADKGRLAEEVSFGYAVTFRFEVTISSEIAVPTAELEPFVLRLVLPSADARQWMESQQVGIAHEHPLEEGRQLHLLIEKDFPCKDRPDEDKADTFQELAEQDGKNEAC